MPTRSPPVPADPPVAVPRERPSASAEFIPATRALPTLRRAAASCTACALHRLGTQVVFGEGPPDARLVLVGEQPGDKEDRSGRPFVGPAGALLDRVLAEVGLPREQVYLTNAVKHFKWKPSGKRRLHVKPGATEIQACRGWLLAELELIKPAMIVCLGATAAQAFLGKQFSVTTSRGQVFATPWAPWWLATYHPSALLRMPEAAGRAEAMAHFSADLRRAADELRTHHTRRARAS